jgi:hypothetical protein
VRGIYTREEHLYYMRWREVGDFGEHSKELRADFDRDEEEIDCSREIKFITERLD